MAPDIYNTVAPTRPAQTRSRAVARPPLGKAVAPHATGGGHGVMPRARRPLAVGVLIGAARTTGDLPPRIPSRGVFGSRLKPRWVATPARVSHAPGPRPRPAPTPAHPTRRCLWSYFGAVGPRRATRVATIARSQRTKYLTRGRDHIWFQGELVSRSQAYFPRGRYRMCIYTFGKFNSGVGRSLARRR
jgi:hypothetical protein